MHRPQQHLAPFFQKMASGISFSRPFRSLTSARAAITPRRNSATCQLHARCFSEQPSSPLEKGNEREHTRGASGGAEENPRGKEGKEKSAHAQWYADTLPAMIPVALLGSAVYIGLQLVQTKLATEKYLDEANARIAQLEEEIGRLQSEQEAQDGAVSGRPEGGSDAKRASSRWWWFA